MDPLDLKIVRTIGIRPYGSRPQDPKVFKPSFIAKRVGVQPETVKARLARMEELGFIPFYQIYPNFRHLGVEAAAFLFRVPEYELKGSIIKRVEFVDGLIEFHNYIGPEMCVDLSFHSSHDLEKKLRLLSEFTGDIAPLRFYDRYMPPIKRELTPLDLRILKALRYNAKRPLAEVAEEVGVSAKTVRRRYQGMAREGSFFITPALDPSKATNVVLFDLLVYSTPDADKSLPSKVLNLTNNHYVYYYVPSSKELGNFDITLATESVGEIEELSQRVRDVPGVADARALVIASWKEYTDWIDAAIDEKIEKAHA